MMMTKAETFVANVVDKLYEIASHRSALARHQYLIGHQNRLQRSEMYAAAKTTRMTGSWSIANTSVNDIIGLSSPAVRSRVRQLLRDFPYLGRAANVIVDFSIGNGVIFQSKVRNAARKADKKRAQQIEDAVNWWMDEADVSGKQHFFEMMRLTKRQDLEAGEFVAVKVYPKDGNRYLPFALQLYEADWLTGAHDSYGSGGISMAAKPGEKETRQGIEYEKMTGRVTGYWFMDPYYGGKDVYVPASQVIHGFDTLRPQQLRGISSFAPGVLIAQSLADYMESEIDAAKMAAKWLALVTRDNPSAFQDVNAVNTLQPDNTVKKIEELENCIIEYLRTGEKVEFANANRPGTTFAPFVRLILTMLSITTGAPYELISGDYQGLNFSTAKIVRNDFAQQLRPITVRHIRQFEMPAINTAIDMAVMRNRITLPGYWQNVRRYQEAEYQPPGMDAVDPLREAKSQIEAIDYCLKSPQEIARERGRNLEDVYDEIAAASEMRKERGLAPAKADLSEKNNPAAVMEE
jgi:lambda family phage portal protein